MAGPLEGIRVVDFSRVLAGPLCARTLLDLGAEVIKVEPPTPDVSRFAFPSKEGMSGYYAQQNAGKRNVSLDLNRPGSLELALRLCDTADIVVENFRAGTLRYFGLDYQTLAARNPRLIYASMTGYGESGPDAEQPGFDSTAFFARSGLLDALTHAGGPPAFSLPAQGDQMAGMNLFAAIAMALLHRERTGEGSEVSTSLHAGGLWSNAILAQGALLGAYVAPRPPRTKPRSALANQYRTSDGRWIQLTIVREDKLWPELCHALERTDLLEDPRFQTTDNRRAHATELAAILDPVFAAHPWPEWRKRLRHHEITFGLLGVLRDVPHDHQAVANGAVVESRQPDMPRTISAPIRMSFAPEPVTPGPGPGHGEHTDEVLSELGYSDAEIDALRTAGALG
jgi:formyl-CoA transferase